MSISHRPTDFILLRIFSDRHQSSCFLLPFSWRRKCRPHLNFSFSISCESAFFMPSFLWNDHLIPMVSEPQNGGFISSFLYGDVLTTYLWLSRKDIIGRNILHRQRLIAIFAFADLQIGAFFSLISQEQSVMVLSNVRSSEN